MKSIAVMMSLIGTHYKDKIMGTFQPFKSKLAEKKMGCLQQHKAMSI